MRKKKDPRYCEHCKWPDGCPFFVKPENGFMETNVQTGEERLVQGCFFQVMPKLMAHVVRAANRPAAALESWRNEMSEGFAQIGQAMQNVKQIER